MPDYRPLGWYPYQTTVRLGLDPGGIEASFGGKVENVIVYYKQGEIIVESAEDERHLP